MYTSKRLSNLPAFFARMRKEFTAASEALTEIHEEARLDWKFRIGGEHQWDPKVFKRRKDAGRPCYSINRMPQFLRQVTGEQKKNRPGIEISPVGSGADVETAEIQQGLVRHIERTSDAEQAYDTAFDHMATGGFGFVRVLSDYVHDDSGDQEIYIQREPDPFGHFPDPRCKKLDYSDAKYWFVEESLSADDFEEEYPDSALVGLEGFGGYANDAPGWLQGGEVRVAEYFWIEEEKQKGKRSKYHVLWIKTNGVELLEGPTELPGQYIPIAPLLGEEIRLEGKRHLVGVIRHARTPQQLYNLWQSAMAEAIALAPKSPYLATPKQIQGYEEIWDEANNEAWPYLPYNRDGDAPAPQRQFAEPAIQAITVATAHADQDLKNTTGLFDPSLGDAGPQESGKAILLRQKQGSTGNFGFIDSLTRTIKHLGRILIAWIPVIYDTERIVRIVAPDGTSDMVPINQPIVKAGVQRIYDLTVGRYDVNVSSGPSYDSMREEAAQSMLQLVQAQPELMQIIGDLLVKNFDWPMAQEISERLKKMLPAQLQDPADGQQAVPPQAQAKLAQQSQVIDQMTTAIHKLSAQLETQQVQAASKERIALIQAKALIEAAALKAKSTEALSIFQSELDHIDRKIAMIPDPALGQEADGPQPGQPQPGQQPEQAGAAQPIVPGTRIKHQQTGHQLEWDGSKWAEPGMPDGKKPVKRAA